MPEQAHFFPSTGRHTQQGADYLHFQTLGNSKPEGNLLSFEEFVFAGKTTRTFVEEEDCLMFLLPLVGPLEVQAGDAVFVQPRQTMLVPVREGAELVVTNPVVDAEINFIKATVVMKAGVSKEISDVDLDAHLGKLLYPHVYPSVRLGQFKGRSDCKLKITHGRQLFVFVIEGAFEVQGRLLERRDGLALQQIEEIEFESLSDFAIILMIEA